MATKENAVYHGPFTEAALISKDNLQQHELPSVRDEQYTNGLVLEICDFARLKCWPESYITDTLYSISEHECMRYTIPPETVRSRICRMKAKKKTLKKGSQGYTKFLSTIFDLCRGRTDVSTTTPNRTPATSNARREELPIPILNVSTASTVTNVHASVPVTCTPSTCESQKEHKLLQYKIKTQKKLLNSLTIRINKTKESRTGHYAKKNVNKRDRRARLTSKELNKIKKECSMKEAEVLKLMDEISCLKAEKADVQRKNVSLASKVKINHLKKTNALKEKSRLNIKLQKHQNCVPQSVVRMMKKEVTQKNEELHHLEAELDRLKDGKERICDLKDDGAYSVNLRMLVNELTALEVAQSKISPVIEAVAHHLFDTTIAQLPDRKTIQNMNDEGHYITKRCISALLEESDHWSLHKDGTTRKKQKILDTTVITSNTHVPISLGFCTVASETGQAIAETAQEHIKELAHISGKDEKEYIASTLSTLRAYMSDRAANEKKSNRLLDEWRDSILEDAGVAADERTRVHHCFCMMHVLLGFHKNVVSEVLNIQKEIEETEKLGRDAEDRFSSWRQQSIPERVAYTASSIFGPVGDYRGARDVWEAHCSLHGIKSRISNYKDNRFNGLFETCAQVVHHRRDFLYVLQSRHSNALLQSVKADLEDPKVMVFVQAMGIIFLQITGPYWNMVESYDVPYLNLSSIIQPLLQSLDSYALDPSELLYGGPPCLGQFKDPNIAVYNPVLTASSAEYAELLENILKAASKGMAQTVRKQLIDFLPGGIYGAPASDDNIASTSFVPKHNLASEHHFGDLDSSQKKRPNCTMHHHSTVHMLKRNRVQLKRWYMKLSQSEKDELWHQARKSGRELRKLHKAAEQKQQNILYSSAVKEKGPRKSRNSAADDEADSDGVLDNISTLENELNNLLPMETELHKDQWVAVAYQDNWYPGIITEAPSNEQFTVNFMQRTSNKTKFKWPNGKDVQKVLSMYLLGVDLQPITVGRGRAWTFDSIDYLDVLFDKFKTVHF